MTHYRPGWDVPDEAHTRALAALRAFGSEPGRSVAARVTIGDNTWTGLVAGDVPRPAASLLKLPLAIAVEDAMAKDPSGRLGTAEVTVAELLIGWREPTVLRAFDTERTLRPRELLRLMVSSSDGPAARWLLDTVGIDAVGQAVNASGCENTSVELRPGAPGGALTGTTTAEDALRMLAAALDAARFPLTAQSLAASTLNSRIPLGVRRGDIEIAHKTGTLFSVAHDVAMLDVAGGEIWIAFLTDSQHDTLVTGYEMGICTQRLLAAFGVGVHGTRSVDGG